MAVLLWGQAGKRFYEMGIDRGVLYPQATGIGVAWDGLISVKETVVGGDQKPLYLDGQKYLDFIENEDFAAEITALTAPAEFLNCDGVRSIAAGLFVTQQPRTRFGLSYRTRIGNDAKASEYGYKLHLVYNGTAQPSDRDNNTMGRDANPMTMSWNVSTCPVAATTYKPTSHLVIDTTLITAARLLALENALYGTSSTNPYLPTPAGVVTILTS